jgi:regulator of sigma E protease
MLHLLISVIGIIVTILFVVGTHEAGHFLAARAVGVKVLTFSIGFGKALFSWRDKSGTQYVFAMIPLGGYVRMLDESEGTVEANELHRAYNRQPFYKKFIIVIAGPLSNFIWAFLLYWLIFSLGFFTIKPVIGAVTPHSIAAEAGLKPMQEIISIDQQDVKSWSNILFKLLAHTGSKDQTTIGVRAINGEQTKAQTLDLSNWKMDNLNPDPLQSLGIIPYEPPLQLEIGFIRKDSPAAHSSLAVGDKLKAVDHQPIKDWSQLMKFIQSHPDQEVIFTISRGGKSMDIKVKTGSQRDWRMRKSGILGIAPLVNMPEELQQHVQYTFITAAPRALQETIDFASFNLLLFGKMLTGKLSLESLGGPITIFDSAGDSLNYGFLPFISFLAFLSVSLGVINLFPIPGLDGGHLFIQIIETILRRPIAENTIIFMYRAGFLFIIFIMLQALINDVLRLV